MSIRIKFFCAFSLIVALACALAVLGFRGVSDSGELVVRLYDGPLLAINHARSAHATFNNMHGLVQLSPNGNTQSAMIKKYRKGLSLIAEDLDIVQGRVANEEVTSALERARARIRDWSEAALQVLDPPLVGLTSIPSRFVIEKKGGETAAALDDLVENVAAYGFDYRRTAEDTVSTSRKTLLVLSICTVLAGLLLAVAFSHSMSKPILLSMQFAESIAAGFLTNKFAVKRSDELGRLQRSLVSMQRSIKARADQDQEIIDRISFLAHHDQLTGLCNRAKFNMALGKALSELGWPDECFSVLMLDLNKFKIVNDTFGHAVGDELLKQVADRLKAAVRDSDVVARLGGDEFAILQRAKHEQREAAIALSLRIEKRLSAPFDLNGHTVHIGTSIGIALAPEHGSVSSDLLRKADLALYKAKADKGCVFAFFSPEMLRAVDARRLLELELHAAIEGEELELHYQPVVDAKTNRVCAMEALIRWRHPVKGLIPPDRFIPLAEETGLIIPMGQWILERACADAVTWPDDVTVAVNLSAVQFKRGDLFDVILCSLVESGLTPGRLELEITESVLLENEQEFLTTIRQLKNVGVTIALDDFGTGYSSLSYLTKFPFDRIKIDRSFTQGMGKRSDCDAVISSVTTLARGLKISITAEGVETDEQAELLREAGVDLLQGYLFGRPVRLSELHFESRVPSASAERIPMPNGERCQLLTYADNSR
ncbi:putative bifunctional diguanylate cyclase/phosphodiesterase [Bradyrhizobium sp.]|jgi:diguanylate cyclase (GGDEF)-like protein|uniref:putative bifunctional diguanylate cyclase/phosphodiesterase n=1 Tax=Bradyrhizobium sp. TaxID=376 RepID=UPI003C1EBEFD